MFKAMGTTAAVVCAAFAVGCIFVGCPFSGLTCALSAAGCAWMVDHDDDKEECEGQMVR